MLAALLTPYRLRLAVPNVVTPKKGTIANAETEDDESDDKDDEDDEDHEDDEDDEDDEDESGRFPLSAVLAVLALNNGDSSAPVVHCQEEVSQRFAPWRGRQMPQQPNMTNKRNGLQAVGSTAPLLPLNAHLRFKRLCKDFLIQPLNTKGEIDYTPKFYLSAWI